MTIAVGEFKAKCLKMTDALIEPTGLPWEAEQ